MEYAISWCGKAITKNFQEIKKVSGVGAMQMGFKYGLKQSLPIVVGYAPVALTFGVLASQYGLSAWEAGLMSLMVYAGASQFIAIGMLHDGASVLMIGVTTLIVNIRHVLMSLSMLSFFPEGSRRWAAVLAQGLTDETFVLNSSLLKTVPSEEERRRVMLGVNLGAFAAWVIFTVLGGLAGEHWQVDFAGFQFALVGLFIVLTAGALSKKNLLTYLLAAVLAIIFKILIPGKFYLILSVGLAAALGAWWRVKRSEGIRR